jgi:integrase
LSGAALELLRGIRDAAGSSEYVFPSRAGGPRVEVKKDWAQVRKAAGITGLRMHDLRHSYASML